MRAAERLPHWTMTIRRRSAWRCRLRCAAMLCRRPRDSMAVAVAVVAGDRDPGQCAVHAVGPASGADLRQQAGAPVAAPSGSVGGCRAAAPQREAPTAVPKRRGPPRVRDRRRNPARAAGAASMTAPPTASMARRPTRRSAISSRRRACKPVGRAERGCCCASIARSNVKAKPARRPDAQRSDRGAAGARARSVIAVQRALADFGYGPIKPTGIYDHRDAGRDRAIRARAQAAGHRPDLRPPGARARRADRPAAGVERLRRHLDVISV